MQVVLAVHSADELLGLPRSVEVHRQGHGRIRACRAGRRRGSPAPPPRPGARPRRATWWTCASRVAHGGAESPPERYVVFVDGAFPGELVRAEVYRSEARLRERRVTELLEPSPDRGLRAATTRASRARGRLAAAALRAPARAEARARRRRAAPHRAPGPVRLEPIVPTAEPWRYRNKMEYSFGTSEDGTLALGFHRRGGGTWSTTRATACSPPSAATRSGTWCVTGARSAAWTAMDRRTQRGVSSQPRRARGPADRRASGPPRHHRGPVRARGALCGDPARDPNADVLWTRTDRLPR